MSELHEVKERAKFERMGNQSVIPLLISFSIPTVMTMFVVIFYNVVGDIFIGQTLGDVGLAAVAALNPLLVISQAMFTLLGGGGQTVMALRLGEKRIDKAVHTLGNSLMMMLISSVCLGILILIFQNPLLDFIGSYGPSRQYAHEYIIIYACTLPLSVLGPGLNPFVRVSGQPNRALAATIISAVLDIIFNYIFVLKLHLGTRGAAISLALANLSMVAFVVGVFLNKKSLLHLTRQSCKLDCSIIKNILKLGFPSSILGLAFASVAIVQNHLLVYYGQHDTLGIAGALAVSAVMQRMIQLMLIPAQGIVLGNQPLIGYNHGARQYRRVRSLLICAMTGSFVITTLLWIPVIYNPSWLLGIFGLSHLYMVEASHALRLALAGIFVVPIYLCSTSYFIATEQPKRGLILSLVRQVFLLLPALFFMPFVLPHLVPLSPLQSLWCSRAFSDITATFLVVLFIAHEFKRMRVRIAQEEALNQRENSLAC